ncbi:unnamed protein product [Symbiodinium natans]|uniref:Uncharacterized protein n=1 Tax=Symbiodinium natans TaxID=878477 RepID=A0A812R9V7_9DINO|nr:unnamed protein product [Symbiodinium natans]
MLKQCDSCCFIAGSSFRILRWKETARRVVDMDALDYDEEASPAEPKPKATPKAEAKATEQPQSTGTTQKPPQVKNPPPDPPTDAKPSTAAAAASSVVQPAVQSKADGNGKDGKGKINAQTDGKGAAQTDGKGATQTDGKGATQTGPANTTQTGLGKGSRAKGDGKSAAAKSTGVPAVAQPTEKEKAWSAAPKVEKEIAPNQQWQIPRCEVIRRLFEENPAVADCLLRHAADAKAFSAVLDVLLHPSPRGRAYVVELFHKVLKHDASANTSAYLMTWSQEKMYLLSLSPDHWGEWSKPASYQSGEWSSSEQGFWNTVDWRARPSMYQD